MNSTNSAAKNLLLRNKYLNNIINTRNSSMNALGNTKITPELKQKIVDEILEEAGKRSVQQLAKEENEVLLKLLSMRAKADSKG
jgi:carnitine 3-dehydrogenase